MSAAKHHSGKDPSGSSTIERRVAMRFPFPPPSSTRTAAPSPLTNVAHLGKNRFSGTAVGVTQPPVCRFLVDVRPSRCLRLPLRNLVGCDTFSTILTYLPLGCLHCYAMRPTAVPTIFATTELQIRPRSDGCSSGQRECRLAKHFLLASRHG